MKILALEKETRGVTYEHFAPHLKEEALHVWELYQRGIVRELYFREDRSEAVLVLECKDVDEARTILGTLPLVKNGLIAFELIPLKAYSGFERLFSSASPINHE